MLERCLLLEVRAQERATRLNILSEFERENAGDGGLFDREFHSREFYSEAREVSLLETSQKDYDEFLARHNIDINTIGENLDSTHARVNLFFATNWWCNALRPVDRFD